MLERLLDSTYSAFDKDPGAQVALRVQHADGFCWAVRDRTLTATTEAGATLAVVALRGKSIAELAELLTQAGCDVVYRNAELQAVGADALLAGSARQWRSDGDVLAVYSSQLWAILDGFARMLEDAAVDAGAAVQQLYLGTASSEWLDLWGGYFSIARDSGELDEAYRTRILVETLRPRVSRIAIEKAVLDMTGHRVTMYEPWRDMFRLGRSALSGPHHTQDGEFYSYHTMQPQSAEPIVWDKPLDIIERNRAAGAIVLPPALKLAGRFVSLYGDAPPPQQLSARADTLAANVLNINPAALGYLVLSGYEPTLNYQCNVFTVNTVSNSEGANMFTRIGPPLLVVKAAVCLSGGTVLGDINCTFGLYNEVDRSAPKYLSGGYVLSEDPRSWEWEWHEQATLNVRTAALVANSFASRASAARTDQITTAYGRRLPPNTWRGAWDGQNWRTDKIWSRIGPIEGG